LIILITSGGLIAASVFDIYFVADSFIFALMYVYCKRRPFETISLSLMFIPSGVNLKSGYFPWVYMGFNVLLGESFMVYVVGLMLGHIYIFVKDIMFLKTHKDYFKTPKFIKKLVYSRN
jgi:Derlin-2/3